MCLGRIILHVPVLLHCTSCTENELNNNVVKQINSEIFWIIYALHSIHKISLVVGGVARSSLIVVLQLPVFALSLLHLHGSP